MSDSLCFDYEKISDDELEFEDTDNIRNEGKNPTRNEAEPGNSEKLTGAGAVINVKHASAQTVDGSSIKKALEDLVQTFKKKEVLPDLAAALILKKKLNTMNLDLFDYDKGYTITFESFEGDIEQDHGTYLYAVSLIEYIRDGEIPYEIFDKIYNYNKFQLFYDGYVLCKLRLIFAQEDCIRTHYVLLKHTIQTINAECLMKCKADASLDFETEKARLICHYFPDLCLDPSPAVAQIIIENELSQHPFITPSLKHIIQNEKARRELGVRESAKRDPAKFRELTKSGLTKPEADDWSFRLGDPSETEADLSELALTSGRFPSILPYIRERKISFPAKDSLTGFHVEIENFVYEYDGCTRDGKIENIKDILCIGVLDDKEYYYGAYKLDERMDDYVDFYWWPIGNREDLDLLVNAISILEMDLSHTAMKITHYWMFSERVIVNSVDGDVTIIRETLKNPASEVVLQFDFPLSDEEDEETEDDVDDD